jgi:hypothetical protein
MEYWESWEIFDQDSEEDISPARSPVLPRDAFEVHEGFRETTLDCLDRAKDCEAVRRVGQILGSLAAPPGSLRDQAVAGLADLRHVQGTFLSLNQHLEYGETGDPEDSFLRRCGRFAGSIRKIADRLALKLSVPPPRVQPRFLHEPGGFRETTLARFKDPEQQRILRHFGNLLYSMVLEYTARSSDEAEGWLCHEVCAAVADLRHLQGHFHHLGQKPQVLAEADAGLPGFCRRISGDLQRLADRLEKELEEWRSRNP